MDRPSPIDFSRIEEAQAYAMSNDQPPTFPVGTAEVSLIAYHMNETLDERTLPRDCVALSSCFRREAGTRGTDAAGLYRVHQFDKVEQITGAFLVRVQAEEPTP